jgi:hypothetical protein
MPSGMIEGNARVTKDTFKCFVASALSMQEPEQEE